MKPAIREGARPRLVSWTRPLRASCHFPIVCAAMMIFTFGCGGGADRNAAADRKTPPETRALDVPSRPMRGDGFELLIPAEMPQVQQQGTFYFTEGTAAQVGPEFAEVQDVEVGFSVYQSPEADFNRRPTVMEWAEHPLPSGSSFRRATLAPPRIERVSIPGAAEAAMSISEHEGIEQLGTGGQKSLSMRLYVKPRNAPGGWVISASADGPATHPQLGAGSPLARVLEQSMMSFRTIDSHDRATGPE